MMFAVKTEVLKALFADPEWSAKMEKAETEEDVVWLLEEFCKEKGFRVKHVDD